MTKSIDRGLTQAYLKLRLRYFPATGKWSWRPRCVRSSHARTDRAWNTRYAFPGNTAGHIDCEGHRSISIDGIDYQAGPLSWFYHYGVWPDDEVDHIDRDKDNNRIKNLRLTQHQQRNVADNVVCIVNDKEVLFIEVFEKFKHPKIIYQTAVSRLLDFGWDPVDACTIAPLKHKPIYCVINEVEILFIDLYNRQHHDTVNDSLARTRFTQLGWDPIAACMTPNLGRRRR